MKKVSLPKDWIIVKSKTRPDHHYYFNTRTNEKTWEPPKIAVNEAPPKMTKTPKKRRNEGEKPTTPPNNCPESPKQERPKLKARRTLSKPNEDLETSNKSNETPQMKTLRQKILEKQLAKESNSSKKGKPPVDQNDCKTPEKAAKGEKRRAAEADKSLGSSESMTPQMKELRERMKARQSLAKEKKPKKSEEPPPKVTKDSKDTKETPEVTTRDRRTRARSMAPASVDDDPVPDRRRRTMFIPSTKSVRKKSDSDSECLINERSAPKRASMTPQLKKNIAQDRIEKLRRSLVEEGPRDPREAPPSPKKLKKSPEKRSQKDQNATPATPSKSSLPSIYENAQSRLNALTERLQNETHRLNEERNSMILTDEPDEPDAPVLPPPPEDSFYEAMEWEPIEDERIMHEIQIVRNELGSDIPEVQMQELPEEKGLDLVDGKVEVSRALYIVIDTNVFLSNLQAIEEARDSVFKTHGRPIIVVPWTVIRELDYIKDDRSNSRPDSLKAKARQAVRFLHQHFSAKHPRFLGQTVRDVVSNRELFVLECPDDEILQACLQIQKSNNQVVLLSYDKNLCNKAMIHDIATLGRNDPLEKIDYLIASEYRCESLFTSHLNRNGNNPQLPTSVRNRELVIAEDLYEEIKAVVKDFLTVVVAREMKNLYGENWERYTIIAPPWTAVSVLKCAIKHWMAAVNESFIRPAEPKLKELHDIINKYEFNRRLRDVGYVIDLTYDLVQCLIIKKYTGLIQRVGSAVEELKRKYVEAMQDLQNENMKEQVGREGNQKELEARADAVFRRFEAVYAFSRDICGAACETVGMACSFDYRKLETPLQEDSLINLQPEIAGNVNRLLLILSNALEDLNTLHKDHRSVLALYDVLENFCSEMEMDLEEISPADVYTCLRVKEKNLRLGVPQLQAVSDHFCRLAAFRCR